MTAARIPVLALTALTIAGCSSPVITHSAHAPAPHHSAAPSPARTPASAFCLDLNTFQVGIVVFRSDVGSAIEGQPLDFTGLRKKAALIAMMGDEMKASAPPGIASQFRTVLGAVATSASKLKPGETVRDVVEPLYGKPNQPAFDAMDKYSCR